MARKSAKNDNFIEFEYDGKEFKYSGRMYPENQKETQKCTITPMTLCLNGVITIKGCKLFQSDKNAWIQGPQYESGKGKNAEYKDYLYIDKDLNKELDGLLEELEKLLDK